MKKFKVTADIGSVKIGTSETSFFFNNNYGDGEHRAIVYNKADKADILTDNEIGKKTRDMRFEGLFEVVKEDSVYLFSYDCGGERLYSFERGRHFVFSKDGLVVIVYTDDMVSDNMKTKENFIANGRIFNSYEEVEKYAKELELRITKTNVIASNPKVIVHLCHLNK